MNFTLTTGEQLQVPMRDICSIDEACCIDEALIAVAITNEYNCSTDMLVLVQNSYAMANENVDVVATMKDAQSDCGCPFTPPNLVDCGCFLEPSSAAGLHAVTCELCGGRFWTSENVSLCRGCEEAMS
jgi:hypothetical protein